MTADLLRKAVALMRERAEASDGGPWVSAAQSSHADWYGLQNPYFALGNVFDRANAEHIASWHPAVALAVADLLARAADDHDDTPCPAVDAALAVATAYLGADQ